MAKMQRAYQQARHNFVAHTQHQGGIKHVMRQRDCGRHGNHVTAEQTEFHTGCALRHAVAHSRHTACHLRSGTVLSCFFFDQVWVIF